MTFPEASDANLESFFELFYKCLKISAKFNQAVLENQIDLRH